MKRLVLFTLAAMIVIASCTKNKEKKEQEHEYIPQALIGHWKLTALFGSTGGLGSWQNVGEADKYTIKFDTGNLFSYSANSPMADSMFNRFELKSDTLILYSNLNANSERYRVLFLNRNELQISSIDHICIEGCASKFNTIP